MAKYSATVETTASPADAFALMADFANAVHWDPATKASKRLDSGEIGVGSRFELTMEIFGRENAIEYEILEFEAPSRVVLRGENAGSVAIDEISVAPREGGSSVTYEAVVTMKGAYKAIGPLFGPVFKRMGDSARDAIGPWLDSSGESK